MNIDQAACKVLHKTGRQNAHKARQHHDSGAVLVNYLCQLGVKRFTAAELFVVEHLRGNAVLLGKHQALGIGIQREPAYGYRG